MIFFKKNSKQIFIFAHGTQLVFLKNISIINLFGKTTRKPRKREPNSFKVPP
jgi:hypothetical protein